MRQLRLAGYSCEVVAPSKIPRKAGDRVKTDRRDAISLADLARASQLTYITVPDERDEAIRDLSRARIDAVRARLKARQQLKALLLRHDLRYPGKTSWNAAHERHLATISLPHRGQQIAFVAYRRAVSEGQARVDLIAQALSQELEQWRMRPLVKALMTLRGVDKIVAIVNHCFHRYMGDNPFGFGALDIKALYMGAARSSWAQTRSSQIAAALHATFKGDHDALHDALYQAELFRLVRQLP